MLTCSKNEQVSLTSFFNFYTKLAESSFLCRFRIESVNVFDSICAMCFLHHKQFRTCTNAFPNEFMVRSYAYCAGKHWILYWIQEPWTLSSLKLGNRNRYRESQIMKNASLLQVPTTRTKTYGNRRFDKTVSTLWNNIPLQLKTVDSLSAFKSCLKTYLFVCKLRGPGGSMSQVVGSNSSYKPITNTAWVRAQLCKLQKGCTRLAAASDKVYQLLARGR